MRRNSGQTLINLTVGTALAATAVLASAAMYRSVEKQTNHGKTSSRIKLDVGNAAKHIKEFGRYATACSNPSQSELQCEGYFFESPSIVKVRFAIVGGNLRLQKQVGGNWTDVVNFADTKTFVVCGDTELAPPAKGVGPLCPLLPTMTGPAGRSAGLKSFFRFSVASAISSNQVFSIQSAAYARNNSAAPLLSADTRLVKE